jgi:hypothetical protein
VISTVWGLSADAGVIGDISRAREWSCRFRCSFLRYRSHFSRSTAGSPFLAANEGLWVTTNTCTFFFSFAFNEKEKEKTIIKTNKKAKLFLIVSSYILHT